MKSPLLSVLFLFVSFAHTLPLLAQPTPGHQMFPIRDRGLYGFMNQSGELVIAPMYQNAGYFHEGFAAVKVDGKYGFIDNQNRMIIAPEFDTTLYFSQGWCAVGMRDTESDDLLPLQWGYINTGGTVLRMAEIGALGYAYPFYNNRAVVSELGFDEPVVINRAGNIVLRQGKYYFINDPTVHFREGILKVLEPTVGDMARSVFIDTMGSVLTNIAVDYDDVGQFSEGMLWYRKGIHYGFIDRTGRAVIEAKFDTVLDFSEGWARVSERMEVNHETRRLDGGIHGYINKMGEWMLQPRGRLGYSFSNGYARVFNEGKWGYMNTSGTMVIPAEYDQADDFYRGLARAQKGNRWYYINTRGKVIWTEPVD